MYQPSDAGRHVYQTVMGHRECPVTRGSPTSCEAFRVVPTTLPLDPEIVCGVANESLEGAKVNPQTKSSAGELSERRLKSPSRVRPSMPFAVPSKRQV